VDWWPVLSLTPTPEGVGFCLLRVTTCWPRVLFRPTIATVAPVAANFRAAIRPIPLVPPVNTTTSSSSTWVIRLYTLHLWLLGFHCSTLKCTSSVRSWLRAQRPRQPSGLTQMGLSGTTDSSVYEGLRDILRRHPVECDSPEELANPSRVLFNQMLKGLAK
jgi:hypothetical protein